MDREFDETDVSLAGKFETFSSSANLNPLRRSVIRSVIAIPVKNEQRRLEACLRALATREDQQRPIDQRTPGIVVFANNCSDASADLARSLGAELGLLLRVVEATLPPSEAHAGGARRAAMEMASAWLREERAPDGVILTTDADSRVSPNWLANNLAAIDAGADAVMGCISLDEEGELLPAALHRRGRLESVYETLLTELYGLFDPLDHNPWPHHATISGASVAITCEAYRGIGGLPGVPLGEDKALVAELLRRDAKIRFAPEVQVVTSGRVMGRAPGGVADTLRLRSCDPDAFCDEALQPFRIAIKRAKWRGRLRRMRRLGELASTDVWARELNIPAAVARRISQAPTFGSAWSEIEQESSAFPRILLTPAQLPAQISGLRRALARLRKTPLSTPEKVQSKFGISLGPLESDRSVDCGNELVGGFVAG